MQELEQRRQSAGGFIAALGGELCCFPQTDCRQKEKREPGDTADITGVFTKEQPGDTGNHQHDYRGYSPAEKNSAGPPRPRQHKQRRDDRDEKKNVIQVHERAVDRRLFIFEVKRRWLLSILYYAN